MTITRSIIGLLSIFSRYVHQQFLKSFAGTILCFSRLNKFIFCNRQDYSAWKDTLENYNQGKDVTMVGMQACTTTLEISMVVSQKTGNQSTSGPSNSTLAHISKVYSIILRGHLFNYVHNSIICNNHNLETT